MDPDCIDLDLQPLINGIFGPSGSKDLYNASKKEEVLSLESSADQTQVFVQGIRIDIIKAGWGIFSGEESSENIWTLYKALQQPQAGFILSGSQSTSEVFWRMLSLDQCNGKRIQSTDIPSTADVINASKERIETIQPQIEFDLRHCKKRQLFTSSQGYLCLGPADAEIGDLITVMPGGKVPYLLRKSGESFIFIGEWSVISK
jgi:hypothetical protein